MRTDIDRPIDRTKHGHVLKPNIFDDGSSAGGWIGLDVDAFERMLHVDVAERDVSHAFEFGGGRNRPNRHATSPNAGNVLNEDVLRALGKPSLLAERLDDDDVVVVLAGDIVDVDIGALRIDPIGIHWKHRSADTVQPA